MATNKTQLFEKVLNPNAYWSTGVTFQRANPVPIDKYSVFRTLADAQDYAETSPVAYPGQIVSVIEGEQEYSEWTFNSGTHTCVWNTDAWYIDTYKCETPGQTEDDTTVIANGITATRTITKPYIVKSYEIIDTHGTLLQLSDKNMTDEIDAKVIALQGIVKGGVNYKGHIDLDAKTDDDRPKYPVDPPLSLSAIFGRYKGAFDTDDNYITNYTLENGWMYNITTISAYTTKDGITFENNDYVIIHNFDGDSIDISAMTRDDIDIIESLQDDYVRLKQLEDLSVKLSSEIDSLSASLSNEIDSLSTRLSADIDSLSTRLSTDIDSLSTRLSNDIDALSNIVSTDIAALQQMDRYLSAQVSSRVTVVYKEDGAYKTPINKLSVIEVTNSEYNTLVDLDKFDPRVLYVIKDTYIDARNQILSNLGAPISDFDAATKKYVDDTDKSLSGEINALSTSLSTTINNEFVSLTGDVNIGTLGLSADLSVANCLAVGTNTTTYGIKFDSESGNITYDDRRTPSDAKQYTIQLQKKDGTIAFVKDVEDLSTSLSTTVDANLSNSIKELSTSLSTTINSEFVSLTGDINVGTLGLSNELSVAKVLTVGDSNSPYKYAVDSYLGQIQYTTDNNDPSPNKFTLTLQEKDGVVALTSDIEQLSTSLSGDIVNLSTSLSTTVSLSAADLQEQIISNDDDITYLSAQLSTVADDHYYRTLSSIESRGHSDPFPDNLLLTDHTDETAHKNYYLLFKYGTLVLSSI